MSFTIRIRPRVHPTDRTQVPPLVADVVEFSSLQLQVELRAIPTLSFTVRHDNPARELLLSELEYYLEVYERIDDTHQSCRFNGPIWSSREEYDEHGNGTIQVVAYGVGQLLSKVLVGIESVPLVVTYYNEPATDIDWPSIVGFRFRDNVNIYGPPGPPVNLDRIELFKRFLISTMQGPPVAFGPTTYETGVTYERANTTLGHPVRPDVGISIGTLGTSSNTTLSAFEVCGKNGLQLLTDLAGPLNGFDWRMVPLLPSMPSSAPERRVPIRARFDAGSSIGSLQNDAPFEFGGGRRNVKTWSRDKSADLVTEARAVPPGWPETEDGTNVAVSYADAAVAKYGLLQEIVSNDQAVQSFRQAIAGEHTAIRANPRRVILLQPRARDDGFTVPRYGFDYLEGDIVPFRAWASFPVRDAAGTVVDTTTQLVENGTLRIYGLTLVQDDETGEIVETLKLVDDA